MDRGFVPLYSLSSPLLCFELCGPQKLQQSEAERVAHLAETGNPACIGKP